MINRIQNQAVKLYTSKCVSKEVQTVKRSTNSNAKKQSLFSHLKHDDHRLRHSIIAVASAIILFLLPTTMAAQIPQGNEFRVNTHTISDQALPSTAMDDDGDFVITWASFLQDGSRNGVYAQRYNNTGTKVGVEFQVNTTTAYSQNKPSVAMDSDGDFVIVWQSEEQDGDSTGIFGQRYDNTGTPLGSEFQVNTYTTNSQNRPAIAMDDNGDFVVVWQSRQQDGNSDGIFGQRYNNTGTPVGSEFQVNTYTINSQNNPVVAMDSDGDFVVTWSSFGQNNDMNEVYAQRYSNTGATVGGEFKVNTYITNEQTIPSIAMDGNGNFVITWTSYEQDGSGTGIYGQRYNNIGTPIGLEFPVNTHTTNNQGASTVAMDNDGHFVITWTSYSQDGSHYGVYAQQYDNTGTVTSNELLVNTTITNNQGFPSIAMSNNRNCIISWMDQGALALGGYSNGKDGSGSGVYAQRFSIVALPVELTSFTAEAQDNQTNLLQWETASEENNKGFEVQRSADGESWEAIDFVEGNGTTLETQHYIYIDEQPFDGINYYRLKQVDLDGKFEYSKITFVGRQVANINIKIFPNPVVNKLTISTAASIENVIIYNNLGQVVKQFTLNGQQPTVDVHELENGIYTIQLHETNGQIINKQFIK